MAKKTKKIAKKKAVKKAPVKKKAPEKKPVSKDKKPVKKVAPKKKPTKPAPLKKGVPSTAPQKVEAAKVQATSSLPITQPETSHVETEVDQSAPPEAGMKEEHPSLPITSEPKIPRNAPCPCGSGMKYKKCCLK